MAENGFSGRERDPDNSEVAQLIRQSLQADREREDRRQRMMDAEQQQSDTSTVQLTGKIEQNSVFNLAGFRFIPGSTNTSVSDGPVSPTVNQDCVFENEQDNSESLRNLLQEVSGCYVCFACSCAGVCSHSPGDSQIVCVFMYKDSYLFCLLCKYNIKCPSLFGGPLGIDSAY